MKRFLKLIAIAVTAMAMFAVIPLSACGNGAGASEAQKYRVSFSAGVVGDDAVTGMPSAVEVENGGTAQRPEEIPSRDGFTFKNWYTEASGGSVFDFANTAITKIPPFMRSGNTLRKRRRILRMKTKTMCSASHAWGTA